MRSYLNFYGDGIHKTKSGHLRYFSPKKLRDRYVHRVVIEKLMDETPFSIRLLLPFPYEVHHQDYNKEHNCPQNLMILSESLHSSITADRPRNDGGRFGRKYVPRFRPPNPQWELDLKDIPF